MAGNLADTGATVLVTANALRLLRKNNLLPPGDVVSAGLSRAIPFFVHIIHAKIIYFLLLIKPLIRNSVI